MEVSNSKPFTFSRENNWRIDNSWVIQPFILRIIMERDFGAVRRDDDTKTNSWKYFINVDGYDLCVASRVDRQYIYHNSCGAENVHESIGKFVDYIKKRSSEVFSSLTSRYEKACEVGDVGIINQYKRLDQIYRYHRLEVEKRIARQKEIFDNLGTSADWVNAWLDEGEDLLMESALYMVPTVASYFSRFEHQVQLLFFCMKSNEEGFAKLYRQFNSRNADAISQVKNLSSKLRSADSSLHNDTHSELSKKSGHLDKIKKEFRNFQSHGGTTGSGTELLGYIEDAHAYMRHPRTEDYKEQIVSNKMTPDQCGHILSVFDDMDRVLTGGGFGLFSDLILSGTNMTSDDAARIKAGTLMVSDIVNNIERKLMGFHV